MNSFKGKCIRISSLADDNPKKDEKGTAGGHG